MKTFKLILKILLSIIILLLVYAFLWGPLFPWGPKIGYIREEHEKAIFYTKDKNFLRDISDIDKIIAEEEAFHGLKYKHKVKIIVTGSKTEFKLMVPYLPSGVGGITTQFGNSMTFNRAKIDEHSYLMDGYIKHELSHELIYQNSGFLNAFKMYKQFSIEEGIATYYGGPYDYYSSKDEYLKEFKAADLRLSQNPLLFYDGLRDKGGKLSYTTYRYFFEYLSNRYGQEKLTEFIIRYTTDPGGYDKHFTDLFGENMSGLIKDFDLSLRNEMK